MGGDSPRSRLLGEHLGLALTVAVFVTVGLRVLAAARGSASSALGVLQNADPVEVFIGMGIQLLPLFPLLAASLVIFVRSASTPPSLNERRRQAGGAIVAAGLGIAGASLLAPYHWAYVVALVAGIALALCGTSYARGRLPGTVRQHRNESTRTNDRPFLRRSRWVAIAVTTAVYLLLAFSPTMWLPRETLSRPRAQPTVGFVLSADAAVTVVLTSDARRLVRLQTEAIEARRICVLKEGERPLLFQVIGGDEVDYPVCPASDSPPISLTSGKHARRLRV